MRALYVHIPFCLHICSYCDFSKVYYNNRWANEYLEALRYEINDKHIDNDYETVYIGGGTPTSLNEQQLDKLLSILEPYTKHVKEYSIEINPETLTKEKVAILLKYHINRVSIGVQCFNDELLKGIDRYHTSIEAINWIKYFKSVGIKDMNVDLIYGLPHQTLEDVYHDIDIIDELNISHVSIYSLILEDRTKLKNQNYQPLDDEEDAYWYDSINQYLKEKGFIHYEVSNYYRSKPSYHNLTYWLDLDYEGIGLSAHSLKNHYRYENTKSITKYLNHDYLYQKTYLDFHDRIFEKIMMGLRLTEGINIDDMNDLFDIDFINMFKWVIEKYMKLDMLEIKDHKISTTELGMKYLNTILVDFLEVVE